MDTTFNILAICRLQVSGIMFRFDDNPAIRHNEVSGTLALDQLEQLVMEPALKGIVWNWDL